MTLTRYHLTTATKISTYGGNPVVSGTNLGDGTYRALVDFQDADIEWVEECLDADDNVLSYRAEALQDEPATIGRPMTLPGPIGALARALGGVQVLCGRMGGVAPSTVRRWANDEIQPRGPARLLLDQLLAEHRIPDLALVEYGGEVRVEDLRNRRCSLWLDHSERDLPLEDFELDLEIGEGDAPGKVLRRW